MSVRTKWNGETVATIDMLLALFVVMLALAVLVQPHKPKAADQSPGQLTIEMTWPLGEDDDVDLWTQAPGGRPVGYSNKTDHGMALLRDDLGAGADMDSRNYEIAIANVVRPGLYIVNAHFYRYRRGHLPLSVTITVKLHPVGGDPIVIATVTKALREGQELTFIRFRMDDKGQLVPGSINDIPTPLRAA
jgi:hypothetical protein